MMRQRKTVLEKEMYNCTYSYTVIEYLYEIINPQ